MLYVATRQPLYAIAGVAAGCGAAVIGYHLFSHIKVRVAAWQDPFAAYSEGGYQIAQSLFAIGSGGWFGTGLFRGQPDTIPVAETDLIFSAMTEEMGLIFTLCLILVCVSCYVMFLNIAMELRNFFYKLVALGPGTCYIFSGISADRRSDKVHSVNRSNTSIRQLWWKFSVKYDDHVWDYSGALHCQRR